MYVIRMTSGSGGVLDLLNFNHYMMPSHWSMAGALYKAMQLRHKEVRFDICADSK